MPLVVVTTYSFGKPDVKIIDTEKEKKNEKETVQERGEEKCRVKNDTLYRLASRLVSLAHHDSIYERNIAFKNMELVLATVYGTIECNKPDAANGSPTYDFDPKIIAIKNIVWMCLETGRNDMIPEEYKKFGYGYGKTPELLEKNDLYRYVEEKALARRYLVRDGSALVEMWQYCENWITDHWDIYTMLCGMLCVCSPVTSEQSLEEVLLGD